MKNIKLVVLYQVIMHYRAPLYQKLANDAQFDFVLYYGKGKMGTKLVNTNLSGYSFAREIIKEFRLSIGKNSFAIWPLLIFKLIKLNPDVVFSEGSSSIFNSTIAFVYSKLFKKKFIWWSLGQLENKEYKGFRKFINKWELFIEKRSDAIFTYSTQGYNYFFGRGIDRDKIFIGVNVLDTNKKLEEIQKYNDTELVNKDNFFHIAFIGTITAEKNLELVIDVINELNLEKDRFRLHIIGSGPHEATLHNYIETQNIDKDFYIFHGRINEGASRVLKNCHLMVLPGLGGLAICDGMINSLPIITGKADGTELDLVDDDNGYVIQNLDKKILKEKVMYLYNNPIVRNSMAISSFKKITEVFTFDKYYEKFVESIFYSLKNK